MNYEKNKIIASRDVRFNESRTNYENIVQNSKIVNTDWIQENDKQLMDKIETEEVNDQYETIEEEPDDLEEEQGSSVVNQTNIN